MFISIRTPPTILHITSEVTFQNFTLKLNQALIKWVVGSWADLDERRKRQISVLVKPWWCRGPGRWQLATCRSCGAIPPQAVAAARPRRRQLLSCSLGSTSRRAHPAPSVFMFVRVLLIANNRVRGFYSYIGTAERSPHRRAVY